MISDDNHTQESPSSGTIKVYLLTLSENIERKNRGKVSLVTLQCTKIPAALNTPNNPSIRKLISNLESPGDHHHRHHSQKNPFTFNSSQQRKIKSMPSRISLMGLAIRSWPKNAR
jgi:hypothetical protein